MRGHVFFLGKNGVRYLQKWGNAIVKIMSRCCITKKDDAGLKKKGGGNAVLKIRE